MFARKDDPGRPELQAANERAFAAPSALIATTCHRSASIHEQLDDIHRLVGWWLMRGCCLAWQDLPSSVA
jgi:hypothetical protein